MNIITATAVRKRISVVVLAFLIILLGSAAYNSLPRESTPDITIPYVFITTPYPGVAPEDIETSITIPIEKKLKGLDSVKHIRSSSTEGMSSIVVEFVAGTDIDDVLPKAKDKVDLAKRELPSDLEDDPEVTEINLSEMPILTLALTGNIGMVRLKELAEDLEEDIESIPGVLEADVTGGLEREIRVEPFPEKLAYYHLSILELQTVIANENLNVSGGSIRMGDGRFQLRVPGEFQTPGEIYGLIVGTHEGGPVYLKDVARVKDGFKDEAGRSRLDGRRAVSIQVKKRVGENIIRIVEDVNRVIEERSLTWPAGTEISKLMNEAEEIEQMVNDLENNILSGLILVIVVLFFALGARNAVLVGTAIPFSMLISFLVLSALGITLNMVVLFSLTLALGMLVDNAIVIVENIFRYMQQGVPRLEAAVKATAEVALPVTASTLTTLAVFFPLLFWTGIVGEFMAYLPITVIITLSSSLFVALVINPALAAIFLRLPSGKPSAELKVSAEEIARAGEAPVTIKGPVLKAYQRMLAGAINHRAAVLSMAFLIVIAMVFVWLYRVGLEKSIEFFPAMAPENIYLNLNMPEGADLEYSDRIARQVELALCKGAGHGLASPDENPADCYYSQLEDKVHTLRNGRRVQGITDMANVKHIYSRTVAFEGGTSLFEDTSPNRIGVQFYDIQDRLEPSSLTVEEIRKRIEDIPGGQVNISEQQMGPPTGRTINIEIAGDNFHVLGLIARQVRQVLEKMPFVHDISDDFETGSPTVKVRIDRQRTAMLGLSTNTVGFALKVAYNGIKVSTFREGDEDYDLTVQLPKADREKTDILRELLIPTAQGLVPLSTIAKFEVTGGLGRINRIDHERVVTITANVDETKSSGAVVRNQAKGLLDQFRIPPGYKIRFTGEQDMQTEAEDFLKWAFAVAAFLVIIILVPLFDSITQPAIVMTSVLLSFGGVFLGLSVMKFPFGIIMTGIGVISLVGVVVNNAIVLVDYTNRLRQRGIHTKEAIIAAGCTRLRPVMLTAVTTILGLLPMVTGVSYDFRNMRISWVSESSQYWGPMAIAVIFGLGLATVLTLVVVPTLYSLAYTTGIVSERGIKRVKKAYWAPFYRLTGAKPEEE
jgi:multidrug efflux pump